MTKLQNDVCLLRHGTAMMVGIKNHAANHARSANQEARQSKVVRRSEVKQSDPSISQVRPQQRPVRYVL
jgi:hypothetical protein